MDNKIFDFIFKIALDDATKRVYSGNKSTILKNQTAKNILRQHINAILNGEAYDFYSTEQSFRKEVNKSNPDFTFGNCQKIINIVCKNFYITTYGNNDKKKNFQHCHCPMDRIMKNKVLELIASLNNFEINLANQVYTYKDIKKIFVPAWSKQNDTFQYRIFQACVSKLAQNDNISPLEFDYNYWQND